MSQGGAGTSLARDGTVVIVGAALSGLRAAETLRAEGFEGRLLMVGDELHLPYDRPPLSKQILAGKWPPERAVLADRTRLDEMRVELLLGHRATSLDADARRVTIDDGSVLQADAVLVASGARPRRLPGTEAIADVRTLRTLDDSIALRARVTDAGPGCRVVVVGAGFIGSEVASTCADLGCTVTVLEALGTPLAPALGEEVGGACARLHAEHGVDLRTATGVTGITEGDDAPDGTAHGSRRITVTLNDGGSLDADVVVVGIGVVPNVEWLEGSGLTLGNGVECDAQLMAADGVAAAGDLARWEWHHDGEAEPVRIEHWQLAAEMGVAAARSLLAGRTDAPRFDPVPYFWSDQYGVRLQMIGHPRPDDEVDVVDGSLKEGKFVALYGRRDRLTAAFGIGRPRQLMAFRPLLEAGSSFQAARALLSERSPG